jgi:shikimate kinase
MATNRPREKQSIESAGRAGGGKKGLATCLCKPRARTMPEQSTIEERIFLTGVSCVGKTGVGKALAALLRVDFFDLDDEVEKYFGTSIERLQNQFLTMHSFREKAAEALVHLLAKPESHKSVIALSPSGLMGGYLRVIRKASGITVALSDRPENILARIRFYDIDSNPIEKVLTAEERQAYLKEIRKDMTYFRPSYKRADLVVDIAGLGIADAAHRVRREVEAFARSSGKAQA